MYVTEVLQSGGPLVWSNEARIDKGSVDLMEMESG